MELDKGRLIVLVVAAVSIAVWLIVFPLVLIRGPAGAFSGEDAGRLCIEGGEDHADHDLVRFVRRFHYLGVRSEVKTGPDGELCFLVTLARRVPEVAQAILRKGELQVFPIREDQSPLFPEGVPEASGLVQRDDTKLGPAWTATSAAPVQRLLDAVRADLPGLGYPYCRKGRCTAVLAEPELIVGGTDVMATFPIRTDAGEPALLMRLTPPALQRITAIAEKDGEARLAFVVDGGLLAVASLPAPEADGQVTVRLDERNTRRGIRGRGSGRAPHDRTFVRRMAPG